MVIVAFAAAVETFAAVGSKVFVDIAYLCSIALYERHLHRATNTASTLARLFNLCGFLTLLKDD